jgi:mono/diheme cytochrome c family protein
MVHASLRVAAPLAFLLILVGDFAPAGAQPAGPIDSDRLYEARCASCHGLTGRGDGEYAVHLHPRPRDFTSGRYKFRTTDTGSLPTDDDLIRSMTVGIHGTSMAAWKSYLSDEQVMALVRHLKTFSSRFSSEQPRAITLTLEPRETPENAEAGRMVYEKLKCAACHGTDGRGTGAIAQAMKDDWGHPTRATDLTEPWTFRGGNSLRDIYLRFRTGMNGTPMPSFLGAASESELWQLAVFVRGMARKPLWEMTGDEVAVFYSGQDTQAAERPVAHGEYIARISGCAFCHSPLGDNGAIIDDLEFAGGRKYRIVPFGDFVTYNLTSDKETGLGAWTDDEIKTFVTKGIRRDGSRMIPFPMPWPNYAHMTPGDLNALVAFLRSLPPIRNRIPPPQQPNLVSYLTGKFRLLILKQDPPMYVYAGNAGAVK